MTPPRSRILIVDDEEAILETMTFTFEEDYEVLTAGSAHRALELLDEHAPVAAVITDQRMPEMTGVEFLKTVYESHPNTTRIILTGYADGDAMVQAINEGHVYAYVSKPWEPDELKQLVQRAVELHDLRMRNDQLLVDLQQANVFLEAAIDELPMGALVVDAHHVLRAANRPAREYLGLKRDPVGLGLRDVLSEGALEEIRAAADRMGGDHSGPYEELELDVGAIALRLRVSARALSDASGAPIGRVILLREISHEPLRRRFEEILHEIQSAPDSLREPLERAQKELASFAGKLDQSGIESPGMAELSERVSRTRTALENWLAVDDAFARESYPDARRLVERMRVAQSRWPLPEQVPERVRALHRTVERYYETGESPGKSAL